MGDREQAISYLTHVKREIAAKKERLMRPVQQLEKELEHITAALDVLLREPETVTTSEEMNDFPLGKIRHLTHRQAVIAIAEHNGGVIRTLEAKKILIRAGVMKNTKNSGNMTHNAIVQSGEFEPTGVRGEYRLKSAPLPVRHATPKSSDLETVARLGSSLKTM